jgi:hypothetical protein
MGINNGMPLNEQGVLLHICPLNGEFVVFHFHYTRLEKFLGIFEFQSSEIHYVPQYPMKRVPELITFLYNEQFALILKITGDSLNHP